MKIVVFGLSITSSWGNGHATTYRALVSGLHRRGHKIVFFEKDLEWYRSNRDLPDPEFCDVRLYNNWHSIVRAARRELQSCDVAIVGSYFPDGIQAAREILESKAAIKAFYDIDTPITVSKLRAGDAEYLQARQVREFDLYFSFTGGPLLQKLETEFLARRAVPLYCSFDEQKYRPRPACRRYECDLSYMGTYAADRQEKLEMLFLDPAAASPRMRFLLAGPQYPSKFRLPGNARHIKHLSPRWHSHFYSSSRFTLNLTRQAMAITGYSPSVRLFEAAACGCPIISDNWLGLDLFLRTGEEILVADTSQQVISFLNDTDDLQIARMAERARERILTEHGAEQRAQEFEKYIAGSVSPQRNLKIDAPLNASSHPSVVADGDVQFIT